MPRSKDKTFVSSSIQKRIVELSRAGRTFSGAPKITYDSLLDSLSLIHKQVLWLEAHIDWSDDAS